MSKKKVIRPNAKGHHKYETLTKHKEHMKEKMDIKNEKEIF